MRLAQPDCPDYLSDLNAMHEAEKTLNHEQESIYWAHLLRSYEYLAMWAGNASAERRAEAFLRTIGKWQNS